MSSRGLFAALCLSLLHFAAGSQARPHVTEPSSGASAGKGHAAGRTLQSGGPFVLPHEEEQSQLRRGQRQMRWRKNPQLRLQMVEKKRHEQLIRMPKPAKSEDSCKYTVGEWVPRAKPLYDPERCANEFLKEVFECKTAPSQDFNMWAWKPEGCSMPELTVEYMTEKLKGLKLIYIGDSLLRNTFFGVSCTVESVFRGKYKVQYERDYPAHIGAAIGKGMINSGRLKNDEVHRLEIPELDASIVYFNSVYLCKETGRRGFDCSKPHYGWYTWLSEFDVAVFNTGHWWLSKRLPEEVAEEVTSLHAKDLVNYTTWETDSSPPGPGWESLLSRINKGKVAAHQGLIPVFNSHIATTDGHQRALDMLVKYTRGFRGKLFYQTTTPRHYNTWSPHSGTCAKFKRPWSSDEAVWTDLNFDYYMRELDTFMPRHPRWKLLDIQHMTRLRPDTHPSKALQDYKVSNYAEDCSHFCLGSVPDSWFELLLTQLD